MEARIGLGAGHDRAFLKTDQQGDFHLEVRLLASWQSVLLRNVIKVRNPKNLKNLEPDFENGEASKQATYG